MWHDTAHRRVVGVEFMALNREQDMRMVTLAARRYRRKPTSSGSKNSRALNGTSETTRRKHSRRKGQTYYAQYTLFSHAASPHVKIYNLHSRQIIFDTRPKECRVGGRQHCGVISQRANIRPILKTPNIKTLSTDTANGI